MRKANTADSGVLPNPAPTQSQLELSPPCPPPPAPALESHAINLLVADLRPPTIATRRAPIPSGLDLKNAAAR